MNNYFPSTTSHGTLLGLRITCFFFAIAAVIVCRIGNPNYIAIGLTGGSSLWSLIHLILLQLRKAPHAGFLVALDLFAAVTNIVFGVLVIVGTACITSGSATILYSSALVIASSALQVVAGVAHSISFVFACRDVHVRRRAPSYDFAGREK
ncbi:hypothetical protein PENANT_c003G03155 [Penicillium antarcticum]|uniref:MARVEL domain-containing protein n=1 Tax=Penicillium antarcticum TaxID=416450 RepID=A0A1V6QIL1_9EURO|nr:hypothetical protein PENANT_c003G03155 [Penicillium antarcticum]